MASANAHEALVALMSQQARRMARLEAELERLDQEGLSRKRVRGAPVAMVGGDDDDDKNEVDWKAVCVRHQLAVDPYAATVGDIAKAMAAKLDALAAQEKDYLWLKHQANQTAESAKKERDNAQTALYEATRRQEMDRQFLGGLQTQIADLRAANQTLSEKLADAEAIGKTGDIETQRELARLRREVDTVKTQRLHDEERHGRESLDRIASHQQEVETLNGRLSRRDRTIAELRRILDAKVHEQDGIKAIYGQIVAQRLEGARQMMDQAVAKVCALVPNMPAEARLQLQVAQSVLELSAIGNAPHAPLPVSVVQIYTPVFQDQHAPPLEQAELPPTPMPERPGSPCYQPSGSPFT